MNSNTIELQNTTQIRVRYADTDKMGFVYNGTYLSYFEVGRTELMRSFGMPYLELEREGFFLPLIEAYVKYISPAQYDDLLSVQAVLIANYSPRIRFDYTILCKNIVISNGFTLHAFINSQSKKAVRPPKAFWEKLNKISK